MCFCYCCRDSALAQPRGRQWTLREDKTIEEARKRPFARSLLRPLDDSGRLSLIIMSGTESNALKLMRMEKGSRTTHARAPVHTPRSQRQKQQAGFVVPSAVAFRLVHGVVLMMSMMMRDVVYSFRSSVLFAAILQYGAMLLPDACTEEKKRAQSVLSSSLCINMHRDQGNDVSCTSVVS